jgi:hypothetical protein
MGGEPPTPAASGTRSTAHDSHRAARCRRKQLSLAQHSAYFLSMQDDDLNDLRELWTSPAGRFQLHSIEAAGGLLPFDAQHQQAVLIEDDALAQRVIARMLDAGVPVVRIPAPCLVDQCPQRPVRDSLCAQHLAEYEAAQEHRQRQGLTRLEPQSWAEAHRRSRKRR